MAVEPGTGGKGKKKVKSNYKLKGYGVSSNRARNLPSPRPSTRISSRAASAAARKRATATKQKRLVEHQKRARLVPKATTKKVAAPKKAPTNSYNAKAIAAIKKRVAQRKAAASAAARKKANSLKNVPRPVGRTAPKAAPRPTGGGSFKAPVKKTVAKAPAKKNSSVPAVDPLLKRAQDTVAAELDPQIAELKRQKEEGERTGAEDLQRITTMYKLAGDETESNRAATKTGYDESQSKMRQLYDQLSGDIESRYSRASEQSAAERARLGISDADPDDKTSRDKEFLSGLARTIGTAQQGQSEAAETNTDAVFRRLSSSIEADASQRKTVSGQTTAKLVRELSGQAGILDSTRKLKVTNLLATLRDQEASSKAEAQQQRFLNEIAARKLGISERQLEANIQNQRGKLELARRKNETDRAYKARMAQIAANNSTTRAREAAVKAQNAITERSLKQSQAMKNLASIAGGLGNTQAWVKENTKKLPGGATTAGRINSLLAEFPPSYSGYGAKNGWSRIVTTARYKLLPAGAKSLLADAYKKAYGRI